MPSLLKTGRMIWSCSAHFYGDGTSGLDLQQIHEAGEPFEKLIGHPSWIEKIKHFVGGAGTFGYHHRPLFIDENFANFRHSGEAIGLHAGGFSPIMWNQYRYRGERLMCGQINTLIPLTDINQGDGGTMLIPGSRKSYFRHLYHGNFSMGQNRSVDDIERGGRYMKVGDALLVCGWYFTRLDQTDQSGKPSNCD